MVTPSLLKPSLLKQRCVFLDRDGVLTRAVVQDGTQRVYPLGAAAILRTCFRRRF